jgi:hypothetical protein
VIVFVIIALALLPTIISSVNAGRNATNATQNKASQALIAIISIFYVIGVLVGAIAWVLHETGSLGND